MKIIESALFVRRICKLINDLDVWRLEEHLVADPEAGKLIPGGKGLRKLRWTIPSKGRGKRGGLRVIYYYAVEDTIFLLDAYSKSEKENLSNLETAMLIKFVEDFKHEKGT
jgi:hypothetical protein